MQRTRIELSPDIEIYNQIDAIRKENNMKTFSKATILLVELGIKTYTNKDYKELNDTLKQLLSSQNEIVKHLEKVR